MMINIKKRLHAHFYSFVDKIAYKCDLKRRAEVANLRSNRWPHAQLSAKEINEIKKIWGGKTTNYRCFGVYKKMYGVFDPHFCPDDYYDFAEHVLNLRWSAYFLQHKCNLKYFIPERNRAINILRKIDGHYVNEKNEEISEKEAISVLMKHPVFMAKKGRATGGGKGVRKIVLKEIPDIKSFWDSLLVMNDIEFENVIEQNKFLSQFNEDSVNTFRMLTLNINGSCTLLSTFLRMGTKGVFVDNIASGGIWVGIDPNGKFCEYGLNLAAEKKLESSTGIVFKNQKVPNWEYIKNKILDFHRLIPYANLIGWDVTLDKEGEPIVVEVNLDSCFIEEHQVFNGPVFGERLMEVMQYIDTRKPLLMHQMMTY
jgi:hypothetical protein